MKVVGRHTSQGGILIALNCERQGPWNGTAGVVCAGLLLVLLEHFRKLHISATRQQKAPTGFLCSFIAGSEKEIKRIGDCFPGSLG